MNEKAMQMIEEQLGKMIDLGRRIEQLVIYVSPASLISAQSKVETKYGPIRVVSNPFCPKGVSYIMEDPGDVGRRFEWVSRNET